MIYSNDPETVFNAFRLGVFSLGKGDSVRVFLLAKGVESETLDDNQSPYDDNVNWKDPGEGDGFCTQGYGTLLAHYRKDVPVKFKMRIK